MNLKQVYKIYQSTNKGEMLRISIGSDNQMCKVCRSTMICYMCKRFGKKEGEKLMLRYKKYLNDL